MEGGLVEDGEQRLARAGQFLERPLIEHLQEGARQGRGSPTGVIWHDREIVAVIPGGVCLPVSSLRLLISTGSTCLLFPRTMDG